MKTDTHLNFFGESAETNSDRELRDDELQNVAGGDSASACGTTSTYKTVGLGLRKSAGNQASGVMF